MCYACSVSLDNDTWKVSELERELGALCKYIRVCLCGRLSRATSSWCRACNEGSLATSPSPFGVTSWSITLPPKRQSFGSDLMHERRPSVCSKSPYTSAVLPLNKVVMLHTGLSSKARVATFVGMTLVFTPISASLSLKLIQPCVLRSPK